MKRNVKRLALNRETLRYLDERQMNVAGAGISARPCPLTQTCFATYFNCPPTTISEQSCPTDCGQTYC